MPAGFSFLILLLTSSLLAFVCFTTRIKTNKKFWFVLSFIFLFLACDELMEIHENISKYIKRNYISSVGGSDFVWVLPYGIFAVVVGVFFLKFVLSLPKKIRNLILISGFTYVGCALGIDYIQGIIERYIETENLNHFYYKIFTIIEEPGEMLGIILFIYALLNYILFENRQLTITLTADKRSELKNKIKESYAV
jgi:hypothetical protein